MRNNNLYVFGVVMLVVVVIAALLINPDPQQEDSTGNAYIGIVTKAVINSSDGWTNWLNRDSPGGAGDYESRLDFPGLNASCSSPIAVQCVLNDANDTSYLKTGQVVTCDAKTGLVCKNSLNNYACKDYKVKFRCLACFDSDRDDYYTIGFINGTKATGMFTTYDSCFNSTTVIERICSGTTPSYRMQPCPYGCVSDTAGRGKCAKAPAVTATCVDSDGGINNVTFGSVSGLYSSGVSYTMFDECADGRTLTERRCVGTAPNWTTIYCPIGCSDGVCLRTSAPTCVDSDGGINNVTFGSVSGLYSSGVSYSLYDECNTDGRTLTERRCVGTAPNWTTINCPYGCSNGACSMSPIAACTDTDGGPNYEVPGTVTNPPPTYTGGWADACISNVTLQEGSCVVGMGVHTYNCPSGCRNGACLSGILMME